MALSSALNASLSGLTVTARRAEVVATNIANAGTPGFARREVSVQPNAMAPGVQIRSILRHGDLPLTTDRRTAAASSGAADFLSQQLLRLEKAYGAPGEGGGLTDAIARFDSALIEASANPSSTAILGAVLAAAKGLTGQFAQMSETIQQVRRDADSRIASDVNALNVNLANIADLDVQIATAVASGRDSASLVDQRLILIDKVAQIVPLREVARPDGRPALVALSGAVLLDGRPASFGFSASPSINANTTWPLSGLLLNGQPLPLGPAGLINGGGLAAAFTLRDSITPGLQTGLDALAQDLAARLAAADPSLTASLPGLLTDTGGTTGLSPTPGLSSRLQINPLADPETGGDLRFLRDGFGSAQPGPIGDGSLFNALHKALAEPSPRPFAAQAAGLLDTLSARRITAEGDASRAAARASLLTEAEAANGVSTDRELQDLMQIEKAYAANARVMQIVDDLLRTLLEV